MDVIAPRCAVETSKHNQLAAHDGNARKMPPCGPRPGSLDTPPDVCLCARHTYITNRHAMASVVACPTSLCSRSPKSAMRTCIEHANIAKLFRTIPATKDDHLRAAGGRRVGTADTRENTPGRWLNAPPPHRVWQQANSAHEL